MLGTSPPGASRQTSGGYRELFAQDRDAPHWAVDYARRLADRHPPERRVLIQTSMSPTGYFHIGNFRDTVCAHLVHRALARLGRRSAILLSFDDYDPVRESQAARDPELADCAGRPLAARRERAARICRAYVAELRAVGILPPDADADGHTPPGSHWRTHYQRDRYLAGEYETLQRRYQRDAGRLARLLGRADGDGRDLFAVYCLQCGRNTTEIHRLDARAARYRCLSCGAALTARFPGDVKPSWALDWTLRVAHERIDCEPAGQDHCSAGSTMDRTRPLYEDYLRTPQPVIVPYGLVRTEHGDGKISGSRGGGPYVRDLLAVFPAPLVLWLYARRNCLSDLRLGFGRALFLGAYDEFDRFVRRAGADDRARTLWELLTDEPYADRAALPGMRSVLGALYAHGCDRDAALRELLRRHPEADRELLSARTGHALAWLALHGDPPYGEPEPAAPAGAAVGELAARLAGPSGPGSRPGARPMSREECREIYRALLGADHGPRLDTLAEVFTPRALADALTAYRDRGERPLRERMQTALDDARREAGRLTAVDDPDPAPPRPARTEPAPPRPACTGPGPAPADDPRESRHAR
ncbi:nucleotidyl transferase family protein [Streptomyces jumonjinensis]|uniref:Lysine--tRNA ligase n=1 Tax=Streptomyces jumonjinensis TaxID=1945 RepID=A0A646K9R1_STRJU|nr:lysine--tRNA ligase [Streptomyces jumonjinensis]MQS98924.1 lysine--tRNA ligase [Streptomyces jumonjinensis]